MPVKHNLPPWYFSTTQRPARSALTGPVWAMTSPAPELRPAAGVCSFGPCDPRPPGLTLMKRLLVLRAALLLTVGGPPGASAAEKPNIVFLLADDLGYGDLGCTGHPYAKSPAIDRLAKEGTLFANFYVAGPTCCPSRTGLMTSRFPARFQKYPASFGFSGALTVTELLKRGGYRTGHFGK